MMLFYVQTIRRNYEPPPLALSSNNAWMVLNRFRVLWGDARHSKESSVQLGFQEKEQKTKGRRCYPSSPYVGDLESEE